MQGLDFSKLAGMVSSYPEESPNIRAEKEVVNPILQR